jgi:hypothetical protein
VLWAAPPPPLKRSVGLCRFEYTCTPNTAKSAAVAVCHTTGIFAGQAPTIEPVQQLPQQLFWQVSQRVTALSVV